MGMNLGRRKYTGHVSDLGVKGDRTGEPGPKVWSPPADTPSANPDSPFAQARRLENQPTVGASPPIATTPPVAAPPTSGPAYQPPTTTGAAESVQDLYPEDGVVDDVVAADPGTVPDPIGAPVTETDQTVSEFDVEGADSSTDRVSGILDAGAATEAEQTGLTEEQRVDSELARILGEDSPVLAQARAEAARTANARGLMNSSMAAGMTQDALVKAAMPMAQQNAQQAFQRESENTGLRQNTNQFNVEERDRLVALEAELGQELNVFNAEQLNQAEEIMAQMRTAMEQQDSAAYNQASQQLADLQRDAAAQQSELDYRASQAEADAVNQRNSQVIDSITKLNQQHLQNLGNADIANIQGTYQQLIAVNQTAGQIYNSMLSGMSNILDNPEMTPSQAATAVGEMQKMMEASLRMIASMNDMDIGDVGSIIPGGSAPATSGGTQTGPGGPGVRDYR